MKFNKIFSIHIGTKFEFNGTKYKFVTNDEFYEWVGYLVLTQTNYTSIPHNAQSYYLYFIQDYLVIYSIYFNKN